VEAHVPIVPLIIWGAQRMWTKDHPKSLGRKKIPWIIRAGKPIPPHGTPAELDAELRQEMTSILHEVQESYPHPSGAFWVPARLGGGAPTPNRAKELDIAERARRAAERH
jgi:1-acyl-sn-glycerol-3-phosphate acyltransferase